MLRRLLLSPLSLAGLVFVLAAGIGFYFIHLETARYQVQEHAVVLQRVADARTAIEQGLNARLNLLYALEGMVLALPRIDDATFQHIAGRMGAAFVTIREIELAPNAVIRFVYPAGDPDKLIGVDLRSLPGQKEVVESTIASGGLHLAGPMQLVQGGVGLVARYPIYMGIGEERHFWGFATIVFDFQRFINSFPALAQDGEVEFALRGKDGKGAKGEPFFGPVEVFADSPIVADVVFPNGRWQLAARPRGGWQVAPADRAWVRTVLLLSAALAALVTYLLRARTVALEQITRLSREADQLQGSVAETSGQLQTILDTAGVGITFVRDRRPIWSNPRAAEMFGYSAEEMARLEARSFYESEEDYQVIGQDAYQAMAEGALFRSEVRMRRKDGGTLWVRLSGRAVEPGVPGRGSIWVLEDITALKEYQRTLEHEAGHDALTGLPTRALLLDRLRQGILQARRRKLSLVVAYLDLDGFKAINDQHGHAMGDRFLMEVAQRMKQALREGDTLARHGGDEFIAVLVDIEQAADYEDILQRLLHAAALSVRLDGIDLAVTVSIGVTVYPVDESGAEELIQHADEAMYSAKSAGKNRYALFATGI